MAKKDWMIVESELDDDQLKVLIATNDKSCIVSGCAGSGKSVLALIKAQRIQKEKGDNYQIIVYTTALCDYMNAGREMLGLKNTFYYYKEWKWKRAPKTYANGSTYMVYLKDSDGDLIPNMPKADYVIVDEIQDFTKDEVQDFITATNKNFFFFGDMAQSIYKDKMPIQAINRLFSYDREPKNFTLYRNYRLPIPVARIAQYVGVDIDLFDEKTYKSHETAVPKFLKYPSLKDQVNAIANIIKRNNLTDVGILLPHNEDVGSICTLLNENEVDYEVKFNDKQNWHNSVNNLNFNSTNILREIRDILAAILASFDHQATERQKERLQYLYSRIQPEIPFFSKLKGLIPEDGPLFNAVVSLVREEYGYIRGELNADSIIKRLIATSTGNEVKNPVIEEIDHHIKQTESVIWQKSKPVLIEDEQIVVKDGRLVQIKTLSGTDKVLYMAWINDVLSKDEYTGKTSTFKDTLSDDVTIKSKEVYNDGEWKGSYPEITLNALRRHTRGENFEHMWINDVFSSISALIISGDDWIKLLQFMQSKEMTDYRIAFSMYGTINGFANLPRDFTDILLNRASRENYNERNSQYVAGVYKEFYKQLFGRDVVNSHNLNTKDKDNLSVYENEGGVAGSVSSIQLKMDASTNEFNSMMNELYLKCPGAKKDEPLYEDLFRRNGGLTEEFVDAVKREKTFKNGRGVQKGVKGALDKMLQQTIKAKNPIVSECIQNQTLFSDEEYKQQINLSTLPSLRCFQGLRKNVLERLNENWQYTSERHPDDKDEHINHFINLCLKEGKNNCSKRTSLKNVFNDSLAQEAKAELYDFYNVRKR